MQALAVCNHFWEETECSVVKSARTSRDMPQFVVVGAGPAGCTAALRAVRTPDVQVTVIEKRSFDSIFASRNSARSYPMVLSGRALHTFTELELDLPCTREPYYGMQFMPSNGVMSMAGAADSTPFRALRCTHVPDTLSRRSSRVLRVTPVPPHTITQRRPCRSKGMLFNQQIPTGHEPAVRSCQSSQHLTPLLVHRQRH